jgi:hypothetical protein
VGVRVGGISCSYLIHTVLHFWPEKEMTASIYGSNRRYFFSDGRGLEGPTSNVVSRKKTVFSYVTFQDLTSLTKCLASF